MTDATAATKPVPQKALPMVRQPPRRAMMVATKNTSVR